MKRVVLAITFIIITFGVGVFSYLYIDSSCAKIEDDLSKIETAVAQDDQEKIKSICRNTNIYWDKTEHVFSVLIGLENTHDITEDLKKMEYFANISDNQSVILYLEECKLTLERIQNAEKVSFSTVF